MIFIEKKHTKYLHFSSNDKILVLYKWLLVSYQICKHNKFCNHWYTRVILKREPTSCKLQACKPARYKPASMWVASLWACKLWVCDLPVAILLVPSLWVASQKKLPVCGLQAMSQSVCESRYVSLHISSSPQMRQSTTLDNDKLRSIYRKVQ